MLLTWKTRLLNEVVGFAAVLQTQRFYFMYFFLPMLLITLYT